MATTTSQPQSSHWSEPLQHTSEATISMLSALSQDIDKVRSLLENEQYHQAQKQFHGIQRRFKTVNNFVNQCSGMSKAVSSFERRLSTSQYGESGLSPQQRSVQRISPESLPDDPRQLEQIVTNATRKLGRSAAA